MKTVLLIATLALLSFACSTKEGTEEGANSEEETKPVFAKPTEDYTSKVPMFTFATTLEEQEEQLKTNPLMLRFKDGGIFPWQSTLIRNTSVSQVQPWSTETGLLPCTMAPG